MLQLLNEKSDEDDLEHQKQNELLQQLLKKQDEERKPLPMSMDTGQQQHADDPLLTSLGFPNPTPSSPSNTDHMSALNVSSLIGTRKRPSDEGDDGGGGSSTKRTLDGLLLTGPQVSSPGPSTTSSGGKSKLWEKNQMLASLLAKEPSKTTTIPPIPASIISAVPQEKLPRVVDPSKLRPGGEFFSMWNHIRNKFDVKCCMFMAVKPSAPANCLYMQPSFLFFLSTALIVLWFLVWSDNGVAEYRVFRNVMMCQVYIS